MKINVNFTIDIPDEDIPKLIALANVDTESQARDFVLFESVDPLIEYLTSNGVPAELVLRSIRRR